jgi:hypothetical protein
MGIYLTIGLWCAPTQARLGARGLPQTIRVYDLRHSVATLLLATGEHPKIERERIGHSSVTLTLDTYSQVCQTCSSGQRPSWKPCCSLADKKAASFIRVLTSDRPNRRWCGRPSLRGHLIKTGFKLQLIEAESELRMQVPAYSPPHRARKRDPLPLQRLCHLPGPIAAGK